MENDCVESERRLQVIHNSKQNQGHQPALGKTQERRCRRSCFFLSSIDYFSNDILVVAVNVPALMREK
jgi:hypothetical protein